MTLILTVYKRLIDLDWNSHFTNITLILIVYKRFIELD